MRLCFLASGSKGNALYVESAGRALLIDCGISCRQAMLRMEAAGLQPGRIEAIVLTHEHRDHVSGVRVLSKKLHSPAVLATRGTFAKTDLRGLVRFTPFAAGERLEAAGMEIDSFSIPHDAADPVGLTVAAKGVRLGLATDLGRATNAVRHKLAGCHALVIEHNHDPAMLAEGPYPPWLKQRVRGREGHLSNQQGAELLAELHHAELKQVVLAHLSETNNEPDLARESAAQCLDGLDSSAGLQVAEQNRPGPVLEL